MPRCILILLLYGALKKGAFTIQLSPYKAAVGVRSWFFVLRSPSYLDIMCASRLCVKASAEYSITSNLVIPENILSRVHGAKISKSFQRRTPPTCTPNKILSWNIQLINKDITWHITQILPAVYPCGAPLKYIKGITAPWYPPCATIPSNIFNVLYYVCRISL